MTKNMNACVPLVLVLIMATAAVAAPTYVWEAGAQDVTTLPSYPDIQISGTDLINGIQPLRNIDLATGWPTNTNGYVPADAMGNGCEPSPIDVPQPNHPGFHGATPDQTGGRLTDGLMGTDVDSVLADFLWPSGVFQFDLPAPTDIGEIRVFAQNVNSYPNGRVWQRYDVYVSRDTNADPKERLFVKLLDRVVTGGVVCPPASPGDGWNPNTNDGSQVPTIGSTLTRVFDDTDPRLASDVTSIRFVFWAVSNTQGVNWDQWLGPRGCEGIIDPFDVDPIDGDGYKRAIEATIVKEIDVLPPAVTFEICDNLSDDDGDTFVDCDDPDCAREPACTTLEYCWNIDNGNDRNPVDDDGDGLANWDDPDCAPTPWSCPPEVCDDGIDNDGNTLLDCDDPDCWDQPVCLVEDICDDGIDNDGDELIDCDDPDCDLDPACRCKHDPVFDVDDDLDVDHEDFGFLQVCFTDDVGTGFDSLPVDCQCMDLTGPGGTPDNALTQTDYGIFEACASGPGVIADPACDDPAP
jgi:hypothetical protein